MSASGISLIEDGHPRGIGRWALAAAIAVVLHAAAIAAWFSWHQPRPEIGGDADSIVLELSPIDSTPDAAASDAAPSPETMTESKAVPEPQAAAPREEPKIEQPPDPAPALIAEPVVKPQPQAEEARPPAPVTAQQVKGGAPRIDPSWQSSLIRQLQRFKRYPGAAQARNEQGVVYLSFSLDRNGHVLAHAIARSSGHATLDGAVLEMIRRAEPLPAFPASMTQARIDLTVPIRFSLH